MESDEARELERTLVRAEAAPYLSYPQLPRWYPMVFAAWFAAVLAVVRYAGELWALGGIAVLIVAELLFLRWFQRAHGAMPWPGKGNPPPEIARVYRGYYTGVGVVLGGMVLSWWLLGHWAAVAVVFVLCAVGFWLYDRRYEAAAAQVRERLA